MTTGQARGVAAPQIDEESVGLYLKQHPDFFERNDILLASMRLPHARSGAAVSLVERQVEVLREKHGAMEKQLAEFVQVARDNDALADRIHQFTRRLLRARSRAATLEEMEAGLREIFGAFQSVLVLFGPIASLAAPGTEPAGRFVRMAVAEDPSLATFESLFASGKPRCGQVRDSQRDFLFGAGALDIGSVALVPLGGKTPFGLLALGSNERSRFHPGMSTEFLARLGDIAADALQRA